MSADEPKPGQDQEQASLQRWAEYPDSVKGRACSYYVSGMYPDDETIGRAVGAPGELVRLWRERQEPDEQDWDALRRAHDTGQWAVIRVMGEQTGVEARGDLLRMHRLLLTMCWDALTVGTLLDDQGEPVDYLTEEETGRKVPINAAIRPRNVTEITKIVQMGVALERLRDEGEEARLREVQFFKQAGEALGLLLRELGLTAEQAKRLPEIVKLMQARGQLPEGVLTQKALVAEE